MKTYYKFLTATTLAKIDPDGKSRSSCTVDNPEYLAWLADGNTPEPADLPTPEQVIEEIKQKRQARYHNETDLLLFKEYRGEVPAGTHKVAVEQIRTDLPYPGEE